MQDKYFVYIPKKPQKSLDKIPQPWHKRIFIALKILETNPFLGEKMHADMADKSKIIIWPYRIIYHINEKNGVIEILEINHRQNTSYK
jgi:mRNA-degrading endonuclease RelE of RelBE toxin-antitoxin system